MRDWLGVAKGGWFEGGESVGIQRGDENETGISQSGETALRLGPKGRSWGCGGRGWWALGSRSG